MFEKQVHIDAIIEKLTLLKTKVELSNPLNLTDVNIISENFYRDFLNLLYGYELININIVEQNADTIDLGDTSKKIAFQVTSTSALSKTRKTVKGFIDNKLCEQYNRLVILNIVTKAKHQQSKVGDVGKYELDTKGDIWDISNLIKDINNLSTEKIKDIRKFLDNEIKVSDNQLVAKEIRTFIALIGYLSDEQQPSAGNGFIDAPDPDGKIYNRFSDHADYLTKEYQDLYIEYGKVLDDIFKQSDIGFAKIRRLGLHLKSTSDRVLTEVGGDVALALNKLVESFCQILSNGTTDYDQSAVKFFLVDQLIRCNVFPNKIVSNG